MSVLASRPETPGTVITLVDAETALRCALDDSEVTNPNGSRLPLTDATVERVRDALKSIRKIIG